MTEISMNIDSIRKYLQGADDAGLYAGADRLRRENFGDEVYLRGIIEFSNHCKQNCLYCGLRAQNRGILRYRLSFDEIMDCADEIVRHRIPTIVLQSGEDPYFNDDFIARIIREIKRRHDVAITLSLGERDFETLDKWRHAGADRYLLRLESMDLTVYTNARPGHDWQERYACLERIRQLGYETGSGMMIGLPGETLDGLAGAILRLTELDLHMIGLGPFVAHPQTPFKTEKNGDLDLALRTLALVRILNPMANMPSTSALHSIQHGARIRGLQVGANVIMPSFTPKRVRELYNIYPGKNQDNAGADESSEIILDIIQKAGYRPSFARGNSPKLHRQPATY